MRGGAPMTQTEMIITAAAYLIVLAQGIFLFIDAKKRNRMAWVWGIVGLIQAPMPLICYYFFVIKPDRRKRGSSNEYFLGNDFAADCIAAGFSGVCPYQLYKRRTDERAKVDVGRNHRMYQYYRADFVFYRRQKAKVSGYAVY